MKTNQLDFLKATTVVKQTCACVAGAGGVELRWKLALALELMLAHELALPLNINDLTITPLKFSVPRLWDPLPRQ